MLVTRRLKISVGKPLSLVFIAMELSHHVSEYESALKVLEVQAGCGEVGIRRAYLDKARIYHPDSTSGSADAQKFSEVQEAYRVCMQQAKEVQSPADKTVEMIENELTALDHSLAFGGRSRKLQHRHYLEYNVGDTGTTLYQRHKAHQQQKCESATDTIFEHSVRKHFENKVEKMPVVLDKKLQATDSDVEYTRRQKFSKGMDRLVNDLILESMSRGEFNNLPGAGKPLPQLKEPPNPVIDRTTERLNQILVNTGFAPQWVTLGKDISAQVNQLRNKICTRWAQLGPLPMHLHSTMKWEEFLAECECDLILVNKMVDKFNLIVPILNQQKIHYHLHRLVSQVLTDNPIPISCEGDLGTLTNTHQWTYNIKSKFDELYQFLLSKIELTKK